MNRLEVLAFDHIGIDTRVAIEGRGYVAYQIFDELRVVIGALGDDFFVRALEQSEEFAGGIGLRDPDDLLNPDKRVRGDRDRDVGALIVGAAVRNFLGARAQAGHGHHRPQ